MTDDMFDHIEDMDLKKLKKALEAREWFIKEGIKWQKKILGEKEGSKSNALIGGNKGISPDLSKPSAIWKLWVVDP